LSSSAARQESLSVASLRKPGEIVVDLWGIPHIFAGPSTVRMDLDVGDGDKSMAVNTPGQSGDPFSPYYRDLFPLWSAGGFVPLLYSRQAIDRAAWLVVHVSPMNQSPNPALSP